MIKKLKPSYVIASLVVAVFLVAIGFWAWPYLAPLADPEQAKRIIADAGPWGPLVFMAMQIVQVFFAPIPGQATGLVGGYLFGPWLGLLYAMVGALIGFTLIFVLVRRLGRPFVERFVSKELLQKFDYIAGTRGVFVLFLIFLLPAFPDDIICYIAGLTNIRIRTLILISLVGRLPVYAVLSFTGAGLTSDNLNPVIAVTVATIGLAALGIWKRAWLHEFVKQGDHLVFLKKEWKRSRMALIAGIAISLLISVLLIVFAMSSAQVSL